MSFFFSCLSRGVVGLSVLVVVSDLIFLVVVWDCFVDRFLRVLCRWWVEFFVVLLFLLRMVFWSWEIIVGYFFRNILMIFLMILRLWSECCSSEVWLIVVVMSCFCLRLLIWCGMFWYLLIEFLIVWMSVLMSCLVLIGFEM